MKISTWNVNSVRARLPIVIDWMNINQPDVFCLQETKVEDKDFPVGSFSELGYETVVCGQKSYNGVSIHFKGEAEDAQMGFPDNEMNEQKRVLSVLYKGIRILNIYVPQGESLDSPKFRYKLDFLDRLAEYLLQLINKNERVIVLGDFNIAPDSRDLYDPESFESQVMFHPDEHKFIARLREMGFKDSLRLHNQEPGNYSWWDYRHGAFWKNHGWRLDQIWILDNISSLCKSTIIDKNVRKMKKTSDHVPVTAEFAL